MTGTLGQGPTKAAPPRSHATVWFALISAGLIWGAAFSLLRIAVEDGAHPIALSFWQTLIGFVLLMVWMRGRGKRLPVTRRHLVFYAVAGLFGTALPGTLYYYAAQHISAGVLSITIATVPMLTFAMALAVGLERPAATRIAGILLGIAAIAMMVLPGSSLPDASASPWVLVAVGCALCYGVENLYIALRMPPDLDAPTVLCGMLMVATVMVGALALATGTLDAPAYPFGRTEWAVMAMSVITVIAYSVFVWLVTTAGPVFASLTGYLVTLSGVAWGIALFGETHSGWIWAAMAVMLAGLTLVKPKSAEGGVERG